MDLLDDARSLTDDLTKLRRELHSEPGDRARPAPHAGEGAAALDGLALEISTGTALTSITAVLRGGRSRGPCVVLRGDMDALPIVEEPVVDFASTNGAMHACGHDLHTAMLVGAARLLAPPGRAPVTWC